MKSSERAYDITAVITLLGSEYGGRKKPVASGYRPSFAFNTAKHYSGEIRLLDKDELHPGESARAEIKLLPAATIPKTLKKNDSFIITEGSKKVGTGIVESIRLISFNTSI